MGDFWRPVAVPSEEKPNPADHPRIKRGQTARSRRGSAAYSPAVAPSGP